MLKIARFIDSITHFISGQLQGILIFLLMIMVLVEVLTRYLMQAPLSIADELGGYFLVSITFLGLAYTWKEQGHVRVELVTNLLPERVRNIIRFITLLAATVFCLPLIAGSYNLLQDSLLFSLRSGSWIRTPMVYPQSLLLVGSVILLLQLISEIIKAVAGFRTAPSGQGEEC